MQHFPIFLNMRDKNVAVVGSGETALAKLRLLMKTEATLHVFSTAPEAALRDLEKAGEIRLLEREFSKRDAGSYALIYAASDDPTMDARTAEIAHRAGRPLNVVDNLDASDFITPAIVDRDPVTIAIGTEGAAPVLARAIKKDLENRLPTTLGRLARIAKAARSAADHLPKGAIRRAFWTRFFFETGPRAIVQGEEEAKTALESQIETFETTAPIGHVDLAGAGPGDPELLTLQVRRTLDEADVIIHDGLVAAEILELARREALLIPVGKIGFGPSTPQSEINNLMVHHANNGMKVLRLKSGDPTVFGRLDEELEALEIAGISHRIMPGITSASAATASLGQSQTRRGRNSSVRYLTGHDVKGFADHDWRVLARSGEVAMIYMGKRAARYLQGRLMMHGAAAMTPISIIENASRPDQRVFGSSLSTLTADLAHFDLQGPALLALGLEPRKATRNIPEQKQERA